MWVLSFNAFYWSMCETMNGKYKDYHVKYFPFLADQAGNIETIYFYGWNLPDNYTGKLKLKRKISKEDGFVDYEDYEVDVVDGVYEDPEYFKKHKGSETKDL